MEGMDLICKFHPKKAKNDVFQEFLRAMGATIAGNIGLEYALVTPLCYRDDCDVSVTF